MRAMEDNKPQEKGNEDIDAMNIKQFIEAARQYLFGTPQAQLALARIPVRRDR